MNPTGRNEKKGGSGIDDSAGSQQCSRVSVAQCLVDSPVVARWRCASYRNVANITSELAAIGSTEAQFTVCGRCRGGWYIRDPDRFSIDGSLSQKIVCHGGDGCCVRDGSRGEINGANSATRRHQ